MSSRTMTVYKQFSGTTGNVYSYTREYIFLEQVCLISIQAKIVLAGGQHAVLAFKSLNEGVLLFVLMHWIKSNSIKT